MFTKKTKTSIDTIEDMTSFVYSHIDFFAAPFNKTSGKIPFQQWAKSLKNLDAERIKQLDYELKHALLEDEKTLLTNKNAWVHLLTNPLSEQDLKNHLRQLLNENYKLLNALLKIRKNRIIEKWYIENTNKQLLEKHKNCVAAELIRLKNSNNSNSPTAPTISNEDKIIKTVELLFIHLEYFTQTAKSDHVFDKYFQELHTYLSKKSKELNLLENKTLNDELTEALIGLPNNIQHTGCLINFEFDKINHLFQQYPFIQDILYDFYKPIKKAEILAFYYQPSHETFLINKNQRELQLSILKKNIESDDYFSQLYKTLLTPIISSFKSIIENKEYRQSHSSHEKSRIIKKLYRTLTKDSKDNDSLEQQVKTFEEFYQTFSKYKSQLLSETPEHNSLNNTHSDSHRSEHFFDFKPTTLFLNPASFYQKPKQNTTRILMQQLNKILPELKAAYMKTSPLYKPVTTLSELTTLTPATRIS